MFDWKCQQRGNVSNNSVNELCYYEKWNENDMKLTLLCNNDDIGFDHHFDVNCD